MIQSTPIFQEKDLFMPIIANAKKALRQQKTRTERNRVAKAKVRGVIKKAEKQPEASTLSSLFSTLDRAVKRHLMHKNKAARIKSRAAKRVSTGDTKPAVKAEKAVKTTKAPAKKAVAKKKTATKKAAK
jgi:small subunit ribosomal protein S20